MSLLLSFLGMLLSLVGFKGNGSRNRTTAAPRPRFAVEEFEDRVTPSVSMLPVHGVSLDIPGFDPAHIRYSSTSGLALRVDVPDAWFGGFGDDRGVGSIGNVVFELPVLAGFGAAKLVVEEAEPLNKGVTGVVGIVSLDGVKPVDPALAMLCAQVSLQIGFAGDHLPPPPAGLAGGFVATVPGTGVPYVVPLVGVVGTAPAQDPVTVGGVDLPGDDAENVPIDGGGDGQTGDGSDDSDLPPWLQGANFGPDDGNDPLGIGN